MMSAATTAFIRLSIRPRTTAVASATSSSTAAASISTTPSLSDAFVRQCNLLCPSSSSTSAAAFIVRRRDSPRAHHPLASSSSISSLWVDRRTPHPSPRWLSSGASGGKRDDSAVGPPVADAGVVTGGGSGSSQHDTWVQFQRSIAVSGFETGQITRERNLGKKNRGGKVDRKRKEREADAEAALRGEDVTQLKGGEFPTLRYSDEETERLLAEAYAAIPPRAGKRGTLNLKRQKGRAFVKLQYAYRKKLERIGAHERRMAKRKRTNDEVKKCRSEADDVRAREREYQDMILRRWAVMNGHVNEESASSNEASS